jgi:hypothetical protein
MDRTQLCWQNLILYVTKNIMLLKAWPQSGIFNDLFFESKNNILPKKHSVFFAISVEKGL